MTRDRQVAVAVDQQPGRAIVIQIALVAGEGAPAMRLPGIGELTDMEDYWRLVYQSCGHVQVLAREGLGDPERARRDVLRYYAECLLCRATGRLAPDNLVLQPPEA